MKKSLDHRIDSDHIYVVVVVSHSHKNRQKARIHNVMLRRRARHCLQRIEDAGLPCTKMHPACIRGGLSLSQTAEKACVSVALDGSSDHDA
jgi:hypothetical protein